MASFAHTPECQAAVTKAKAFEEKYPNFCRTCGGSGGWYNPGNRDTPDGGPCGCVEAGKCPLCAGKLNLREEKYFDWSLCEACGWDEKKANENPSAYETCPDLECWCWESAEKEAIEGK